MENEEVSEFLEDGFVYTFFANGFQYERFTEGTDSNFIQYSQIKHVKRTVTQYKVVVTLGVMNSFIFSCESDFRAEQLADILVKRVRAWLNQPAVPEVFVRAVRAHETSRVEERARLAEERDFRAKVLAKVGDVLDRIVFEPGVGHEALETVDKCNKRMGEGVEK